MRKLDNSGVNEFSEVTLTRVFFFYQLVLHVMATGVLGPAGRIARGPVMVERVFVIDFATIRLHSMEETFAKAKDF